MVFSKTEVAKNGTLILGSVSVGNVGQLCQEILILNQELEFSSSADTDVLQFVIPVVGPDALLLSEDKKKIPRVFTQLEIYQSKSSNLTVVLQRADTVRTKRKQFMDKLCAWIKEKQFKQVIMLTSSFASAESGINLTEGPHCRYLLTSAATKQFAAKCADSEFQKVEMIANNFEIDASTPKPSITGGGMAKSLHDRCERLEIPLLTLVRYCRGESAEENISDAQELYKYLAKWMELSKSEMKIPDYWDFKACPIE